MPPKPPPAQTRRFLMLSLLSGATLSTGCASTRPRPTQPAHLSVMVPQHLRDACPRPERLESPSVGQLAGFSIRQEAALNVCEGYKDAAVAIIDAQNAADSLPKPWWAFWRR